MKRTLKPLFPTPTMSGSGDSPQDENLPAISVTTDVDTSPLENVSPSQHMQTPSSGFLSPHSPSNRGPASPTHSYASDAGSIPPSPTLSSHTNYMTTLQLRDNKPEEVSGLTSLDLLESGGITAQGKHGNATITRDLDGETFRSASILRAPSVTTSATFVDFSGSEKPSHASPSNEKESKKQSKKRGEDAGDSLTAHQRELAQDETVDPAPFRYKPFQLAHMLDPKDFGALLALGGTDGIIRGLGTHSERGLVTSTDSADQTMSPGAGDSASHGPDSEKPYSGSNGLPNIILTEPSGQEGRPLQPDDAAPYTATLEDRKRIYGENILPTRVSKTLLQLMADAMKDKVLVGFSVPLTFILALIH